MVTACTCPPFGSVPLKPPWAWTCALTGIGPLPVTLLMFNKYPTAVLISLSGWKDLRAEIRPFSPGYVFNTWPSSGNNWEGSSVITPTGAAMLKLLAHLPKSHIISEWTPAVNISSGLLVFLATLHLGHMFTLLVQITPSWFHLWAPDVILKKAGEAPSMPFQSPFLFCTFYCAPFIPSLFSPFLRRGRGRKERISTNKNISTF